MASSLQPRVRRPRVTVRDLLDRDHDRCLASLTARRRNARLGQLFSRRVPAVVMGIRLP